jgi:asparagine synthase (glutamine-hydrolysing)
MESFSAAQRLMYYEFHEGRQPWILREFDRISMAHGVEVRTPFLDWRLVVYGFSLPTEIKIKHGFAKYVLRQAMAGVVPDDIRLRKKKVAFPSVIFDQVRGPLGPQVREVVNGPLIDRCSGIDGDEARRAAREDLDQGKALLPWLLANAAILEDRFRRRAAEVRANLP